MTHHEERMHASAVQVPGQYANSNNERNIVLINGTIILVKNDQVLHPYLLVSSAWPWPKAVSTPQACLVLEANQDIQIL